MDALWTPQYYQKVLKTNPSTYWMLDEKSGAVAYDMVSGRVAGTKNGAHTGVTLGSPGIGDGRTSPYYDGTNDYTNIYSVALAGTFNPNAGTLMAWLKVSAVGVWTDGVVRYGVRIAADANNSAYFFKAAANNLLYTGYNAGGVAKAGAGHAISGVGWYCFVLTWDKVADEVRYYRDGVQIGVTLNGLGVWVGALSPTLTLIGAGSTAPVNPWSGWVAHCAIWNVALTPAQIANWAVMR